LQQLLKLAYDTERGMITMYCRSSDRKKVYALYEPIGEPPKVDPTPIAAGSDTSPGSDDDIPF